MASSSKGDSHFGDVIQVLESQIHEVRQENNTIRQENQILSSKMDSVLNILLAQQQNKDTPVVIHVPHLPADLSSSAKATDSQGSSLKRKVINDSEDDDLTKLSMEDVPIKKNLPKKTKVVEPSHEISDEEISAPSQVRSNHSCKLSKEAHDLLNADDKELTYDESDVLILHEDEDDLDLLNSENSGRLKKTHEVSDNMAELINESYRCLLDDDKMKEFTNEFHLPGNCHNLLPPDVNKPIWNQMSKFSKSCDLSARELQLRLGVAGAVLAESLTSLQKMKGSCEQEAPKKEMGQLVTNLGKALMIMGSVSHGISLKRRKDIRPSINSELSALCVEEQPVTHLLFGNDLSDSIRDVREERRLETSVAKKHSFSFQGGKRYFFRGRGVRRAGNQFQQRGQRITFSRGASQRGSFQRGGAPRGRGSFAPSQFRGRRRGQMF